MDEYLHDMKCIAALMKQLTKAMDKLFLDIEKEKENDRIIAGTSSQVVADCS